MANNVRASASSSGYVFMGCEWVFRINSPLFVNERSFNCEDATYSGHRMQSAQTIERRLAVDDGLCLVRDVILGRLDGWTVRA